jgi:hypothetical protein
VEDGKHVARIFAYRRPQPVPVARWLRASAPSLDACGPKAKPQGGFAISPEFGDGQKDQWASDEVWFRTERWTKFPG